MGAFYYRGVIMIAVDKFEPTFEDVSEDFSGIINDTIEF